MIFRALREVVTTLGKNRHWLLAVAPTVGKPHVVCMARYNQRAMEVPLVVLG